MAINQLNGKASIDDIVKFTKKSQDEVQNILKKLTFNNTIYTRKGNKLLGETLEKDYFLFSNK